MSDTETRMLVALASLSEAGQGFAKALMEATDSEIRYREALEKYRDGEAYTEAFFLPTIAGKNEAERKINLHISLLNHPELRADRDAVRNAQTVRDICATEARIWDVRQKIARAEVAALTALIGAE